MVDRQFISWGRLKCSKSQEILNLSNKFELPSHVAEDSILAIGNGRSYGDEAYNDEGTLINGLSLNKFISFDRGNGVLVAECGVTLAEILEVIVPAKWFLPVTPGTKYVTLAGAIANDVHGKNHHKDGSFGCFVEEFGLFRSNGEYLECSRVKNAQMFFATIGGMGLTGVITWAKIRLLAVQSNAIISNSYRFANLKEYFELNTKLEQKFTYTVAWIDCLASGKSLGRGIYFAGEHVNHEEFNFTTKKSLMSMRLTPPISLINNFSLKAFNYLYYNSAHKVNPTISHYEPFFYPLDKIHGWNKIYGPKGFYQYQVVVPFENCYDSIQEILQVISDSNMGSFLAVLKTFGDKTSGGLMSFPRRGMTLALDFPNREEKTLALFAKLDKIVLRVGGAIYPAKDAAMTQELFVSGYKNLEEFIKFKDPGISSNMWNRVWHNNKRINIDID